ncbi:MAG: hypothetical protein IRZ16_18305 [Myxococcaceae bacterium]|nr:hypothetical protein [Myxococcaceae bacterium]
MRIAVRALMVAAASLALASGCGEKPPQPPGAADAGNGGSVDAGTDAGADAGPAVTWYRDVLPLVQQHCQSCHVEGGIASFPLTSYENAFQRHELIAQQVSTGAMPPWMPDDEGCTPLQDSRRLTADEIAIFEAWDQLGAPAGDTKDAPPPPEQQVGLPWVDATLDIGVDYTPNQATSDDYRCFIVPPQFQTITDVIGFELIPGEPQEVHHAILFDVPMTDAQALDDAEPGPGWTCYGGPGVDQSQVVMVGGWVPGNGAITFPENTGIRILPGHVLVMQIHYNLANGAQPDRSSVKLQFAKSPVAKPARIFPVATGTFAIPPHAMGYSASARFSLEGVGAPSFITKATVYGTTPHMHLLGRSITARMLGTNGADDTCLINVPKWDFNWQQSYKFTTPVVVGRTDEIEVTCTWDNPTDRTVTWGEGTSDEMCVVFFYVTL